MYNCTTTCSRRASRPNRRGAPGQPLSQRGREGLEVDGRALIRAACWSIRVILALTLEFAISGLDYLPLDLDSLSVEMYEPLCLVLCTLFALQSRILQALSTIQAQVCPSSDDFLDETVKEMHEILVKVPPSSPLSVPFQV